MRKFKEAWMIFKISWGISANFYEHQGFGEAFGAFLFFFVGGLAGLVTGNFDLNDFSQWLDELPASTVSGSSTSPPFAFLGRLLPPRIADEELGDLLEEIAVWRKEGSLGWRRRIYIVGRVGRMLIHGAVEATRNLITSVARK